MPEKKMTESEREEIKNIWDEVHTTTDYLLDHPELQPTTEAAAGFFLGMLCQKMDRIRELVGGFDASN